MKETGTTTYTTDKNTFTVEKMDLVGLDYLWRVALEVPSEEIAMLAVKKLMELSYTLLSSKLKKVNNIRGVSSAELYPPLKGVCFLRTSLKEGVIFP